MDPLDGRVVSNFITQALQGKDITVYGNGKQTRSFCYIDDLVSGILKVVDAPSFNEPCNLGNPEEYTILELAKKVLQLTQSNSSLVFKDLPQDDPKQRKPDIQRVKEKFDWQPKAPLVFGLEKTISYFRKLQESQSQEIKIESELS